jgi:GrpB-like predicted nucleotidyltransferase (UPF0157 family)
MARTVVVTPYNSDWPTAFTRESEALSRVFTDSLLAIHHIGSTSVPGLAAKPIIDILVVVKETRTIDGFSAGMERLGYRVRGECLDAEIPGTPGRFYFSKDTDGVRTSQVHVCAAGHSEIGDKLAFRDYLRVHPDRANAYANLKHHLATRHRDDVLGYMRGKDEFVKSVLIEARLWVHRGALGLAD